MKQTLAESNPRRGRVQVRVPASTSNLGAGFDVLGLALCIYNFVTLETTESGLVVEATGVDADALRDPATSLVAKGAYAAFNAWGEEPAGLRIHIRNQVPIGKGLGGSATAVVAGILGAAALAGRDISTDEALRLALPFEGHPDNITPALVGGLTISKVCDGRVDFLRLPPPRLRAVICIPDLSISTEVARAVLPREVPLVDAVFNLRSVAFLVASLATHQYEQLPDAMQDRLHEPYRRDLLPPLEGIENAALRAGAFGAALSGAGSSVFAFAAEGRENGISMAMLESLESSGYSGRMLITGLESRGARVHHLRVTNECTR